MQTVTNKSLSQKDDELSYWQVFQCWRPHRVSKIEAYSSQGNIRERQRLMIIKLGKYNKVRELFIEKRTTGSQVHIHYWDRVWRVSVTRVAVHMEEKGMGMQTGHRDTYNQGHVQLLPHHALVLP